VTDGKGVLAIIQGQVGTTPEQDRDKGFKEAMANCPGIKEVAREASKMWMKDEGFNDDVERDLAQKGQVARRSAVAHAAVVLAERDVENPMQRVLNRPMRADSPAQDGRAVGMRLTRFGLSLTLRGWRLIDSGR
jgi:hypothetical protein